MTLTYEMKVAGMKVLNAAPYNSNTFNVAEKVYEAMEAKKPADPPAPAIYWPAAGGSKNITLLTIGEINKLIRMLAARLGQANDHWDDATKLKWLGNFTVELQRREKEDAAKRRIANAEAVKYTFKSPIYANITTDWKLS